MPKYKTTSNYRTSAKKIWSNQGNLAIFEDPAGTPYEETVRKYVGECFVCGILIKNGSVAWHVGSSSASALSRCVVIFSTKAQVQGVAFSDDFQGFMIGMAYDFIDKLSVDYSLSVIGAKISAGPVQLRLDKDERLMCVRYVRILSDILDHGREEIRMKSSIFVSAALLIQVLGAPDSCIDSDNCSRKETITKDFLKLVKEHGSKQRTLGFYARKLCVTPKYLSSSVTKTTKKTTRNWMDDTTMSKARFYLKSTSFTMAQIAELLNFPSSADFVRFFRQHEGTTPLKYRRNSL